MRWVRHARRTSDTFIFCRRPSSCIAERAAARRNGMKRRDLLKLIALTPLAAAPLRLYAAGTGSARLLVVFLRGGYDAANVLVPFGSSFYYDARPNIAVPRPGSGPNAAI